MKFDHFMSYFKRNNFRKNSTKNVAWKLVPGTFVFAKNKPQLLLENEIFEAIYLY